ncbi:MAG: HigA family addiction module antitoxin [Gammaproteobacteria bacterium]|nr:HigA family addiction module antitoxin [Gammaproteobacteria bacterium]
MTCLHPGKMLLNQYLRPENLSQNQLARAIKVPPRRINEIILGKRAISADTALRLGAYFSNSAGYWMRLQAEYDLARARGKIGTSLSTIQALHMDENRLILAETAPRPKSTENDPSTKLNIKRRIMR